MTDDDEFNDDIDWGSIEMPSTPAVTPWKSNSTSTHHNAPSLRECLQIAPVFSREGDILEEDDNNLCETLDVGDEVSLICSNCINVI